MSQSELAKRLGTKQSTVHGWVKQGVPPTADLLAKVPAALGINGHWLLTGEGKMDPPAVALDLEAERAAAVAAFAAKLGEALAGTIREVTASASGHITIGGSATATVSDPDATKPDLRDVVGAARTVQALPSHPKSPAVPAKKGKGRG